MKISNMNVPGYAHGITEFPNKLKDRIFCRDPFILRAGNYYYLYRSVHERGIECLVSPDLLNWSEPVNVFTPPEGFHGKKDLFWAPECHYYKGKFHIFTSVWSSLTDHRCISVYRADNPLGPFEDIADGCVSPREWDCIDGTLYIDEDGLPWMVFVHEWTCMPDHVGAMAAARLSDDLTRLVSEPIRLFLATDGAWCGAGVTDGPFTGRTEDGTLMMIWSNFKKDGEGVSYAVGAAYSDNGRLDGKWIQHDTPVYCKGLKPEYEYEGGHAMMFYGCDGRLKMTFHAPNSHPEVYEHVHIYNVEELSDTVRLLERVE